MSNPPRIDLPGIAGSAVLIAVAALALYYSSEFTPLGSVFPRTVAGAMILFSGLYIVMALWRPGPPKPQEKGSPWRRGALAAVMIAWSLLLETLGFLSTSVVAFTAIIFIANYDRWSARRALGYAVAGALVLGGMYGIFRFGLQVPLPQGLFL